MSAAVSSNNRSTDADTYPLAGSLTRRVTNYLKIYRIIIVLLLAVLYFGTMSEHPWTISDEGFTTAVLTAYLAFAAFQFFIAGHPDADYHKQARNSLILDVAFLSVLLLSMGGLDRGLGILLVFTAALAGILLPVRLALFLASIASIAMVVEAILHLDTELMSLDAVLASGFYGVTTMIACLVSHRLAFWARDFRLIAEKQETEIIELREINELIIRNMNTGVVAVDENFRVQLMNEFAWFLLGSPKVRELLLADLSPRLLQALMNWMDHPTTEPKPLLLEPSQAQVLPTFAMMTGDEELAALIFLNDDSVISRRALELSANSLAKLSGSIAHEIRNPLSAATHAAQLLEESPSMTLTDMRLINIILEQAKRMNGIVENILQLSREEHSRPEPVELNAFLKDLGVEFQSTQAAKGLDFEVLIEAGKARVVFDRSQLHQCLWKLLDNSIHHASVKRIPRVELKMRKDESANYCVISVEDNGPGIPKPRLPDIFEPFFTTRKEGSGLGLYIARQLCEANQAELTVDSVLGQGSSFHIRLALARGSTQH
jgi:two-component system sensor histidine kinase PilS (NtrC family)